jgi:nitric oxide reductase NorE protein
MSTAGNGSVSANAPEKIDPATAGALPARLPGDLAVWFFILAELLAFAVFFLSYAFSRARNVALFNESQLTLDLDSGAINTLLLISSSWFVVRAIKAVKRDDTASGARWLAAAMLGGLGFLVVKVLEYAVKFDAGINMSTNTFYMFYISLTFFHFMHVVLGMVILGVLLVNTMRGAYGRHEYHVLESGGAYWHMVDLLWIVLFPLVYVMR